MLFIRLQIIRSSSTQFAIANQMNVTTSHVYVNAAR